MNTPATVDAVDRVRAVLSQSWNLLPSRATFDAPVPNDATFEFQHVSGCLPWTCVVWVNTTAAALHVRVMLPVPVPPEVRDEVLAYVNAVNYDLPNGCFAIGREAGDLRFKASLFFGGVELAPQLVRHLVDSSLEFVDLHADQLVHIIGGEKVADAIRHVEAERRKETVTAIPPFEVHVRQYLRGLFATCGFAEALGDDDVEALHAFLERRLGSRYPAALFEAPSLATRGESAAREAYSRGLLRCTANADGVGAVEAFGKSRRSPRS